MSATDFLPRREADLRGFSVNFNSKINSIGPQSLGLTAAQAADYNQVHNSFMAAYVLATSPSTRTRPVVVAKRAAVKALRQLARQLAAIIRAQPGVSDHQKAVLGLTINGAGGRSPRIARPRTAPRLYITPLEGGRIRLRLRDPGEPAKRGKPTGARSALIMRWVGGHPEPDMSKWKLAGMTTRTTLIITLPQTVGGVPRIPGPGVPGVWIKACWQNPRSESGPFTLAVDASAPFRLRGPVQVGIRMRRH